MKRHRWHASSKAMTNRSELRVLCDNYSRLNALSQRDENRTVAMNRQLLHRGTMASDLHFKLCCQGIMEYYSFCRKSEAISAALCGVYCVQNFHATLKKMQVVKGVLYILLASTLLGFINSVCRAQLEIGPRGDVALVSTSTSDFVSALVNPNISTIILLRKCTTIAAINVRGIGNHVIHRRHPLQMHRRRYPAQQPLRPSTNDCAAA